MNSLTGFARICVLVTLASGLVIGGFSGGAAVASAKPTVAQVERGIRACVNRERASRGIPKLGDNKVLDRAARFHARNMARYRFFAHVDPWGRAPEDRVALFDHDGRLDFIGENIAAGYASAHAACVGWMHSAGHRANILGRDYTVMGAGFARSRTGYRTYFVQDFGVLEPPPSSDPSGGDGGTPTTPTTNRVVVHLYNVDDQETIYLNGAAVATAGYGETADVDLGNLSESDRVTVVVDNFSGGYTWGVSEETDGATVLTDQAGTVGSEGANGNDQTTGSVHSITFDVKGNVYDS